MSNLSKGEKYSKPTAATAPPKAPRELGKIYIPAQTDHLKIPTN